MSVRVNLRPVSVQEVFCASSKIKLFISLESIRTSRIFHIYVLCRKTCGENSAAREKTQRRKVKAKSQNSQERANLLPILVYRFQLLAKFELAVNFGIATAHFLRLEQIEKRFIRNSKRSIRN